MAHLVLWWRGVYKKGDNYLTKLISRFILAKNRQNVANILANWWRYFATSKEEDTMKNTKKPFPFT